MKYCAALWLLLLTGCSVKKIPVEVKVPVPEKCSYVLTKPIEIDKQDMISLVKNITAIIESEAKLRSDIKNLPCLEVLEAE